MKGTFLPWIAILVAWPVILVGQPAIGSEGDPRIAMVSSGNQRPNATGKAGESIELSPQDRRFAEEASRGGHAEVELGKLAGERASRDEVKQFGQRMVQDHSKANEELASLLRKKGVEPKPELTDTHEKARQRLEELDGEAFDRAYIEQMVKDHEKTVALFEQESEQGNDPDLKTLASKTLPTLQEHLKMAKDLQGKVSRVAK